MSFATSSEFLPTDENKPLDVNECLNDLKTEIRRLAALALASDAGKLIITDFFAGIPNDSQFMFDYTFPVAARLPAGLTGSKLAATCYGPTASTALTLQKKHAADPVTDVGTLTYAQTTGVCTVTFAAAADFAAGDRLIVKNQGTKDVSAQGFFWLFLATRL